MNRIYAPLIAWFFAITAIVAPASLSSAPYAAMVVDARTGEVLHSRSADQKLHPASLTKMLTLYIVFEAVEHGEISLDTVVTVPAAAAAEPPSKIGLRAGQKIKLRYLIRAAAIKSANDAATALAFAIEGSEAAFAQRMNRTAQALGMTRSSFRNPHGLTQEGHLSTARDMTTLGRHLVYDYPQYFNIFSRLTADAGIAQVRSTNRRFLGSYRGADGIKTGYTRAAGYNLVATAERGSKRIIATMFGGTSSAQRNQRVSQLLDMGFARAPTNVRVQRPGRPRYNSGRAAQNGSLASLASNNRANSAIITRASGAVDRSPLPRGRAVTTDPSPETLASSDAIYAALASATQPQPRAPQEAPNRLANVSPPRARPSDLTTNTAEPETQLAAAPREQAQLIQEVVARVSTSGPRNWGINVGRYNSKYQAERVLLKVALNEMETLDGTVRRVASTSRGHDALFQGMTRGQAERACARLQAKATPCMMVEP